MVITSSIRGYSFLKTKYRVIDFLLFIKSFLLLQNAILDLITNRVNFITKFISFQLLKIYKYVYSIILLL